MFVVHDLTNKNDYPNNHRFNVNPKRLLMYSNKRLRVGELVKLINGKVFPIEKICSKEAPANYMIEKYKSITEKTGFYSVLIGEEVKSE